MIYPVTNIGNKYRMMFSGMVINFNHATDECCDLLCYTLRNIPYVTYDM